MDTPKRPNTMVIGATEQEAFLLGMVWGFANAMCPSHSLQKGPFVVVTKKDYFKKADPNVKDVIAHCHATDPGQKICILRGWVTVFFILHEIGHRVWTTLSDEFKEDFGKTAAGLYGEEYYPDPNFGLGHDGFIRAYSHLSPKECFCDFWAACMTVLYYDIHTQSQGAYNPLLHGIRRGDKKLLRNLALFNVQELLTKDQYLRLLPLFLPELPNIPENESS